MIHFFVERAPAGGFALVKYESLPEGQTRTELSVHLTRAEAIAASAGDVPPDPPPTQWTITARAAIPGDPAETFVHVGALVIEPGGILKLFDSTESPALTEAFAPGEWLRIENDGPAP